jgi:hypothetical protein
MGSYLDSFIIVEYGSKKANFCIVLIYCSIFIDLQPNSPSILSIILSLRLEYHNMAICQFLSALGLSNCHQSAFSLLIVQSEEPLYQKVL